MPGQCRAVEQRESLYEGLDASQRAAVTAPEAPLVIIAGAGSGKTTTMVRRVAHMVACGWVLPSEVLAVSHTTKAAGEISERLQKFHPSLKAVSCHTVHAAAWRVVSQFDPAKPSVLKSTFSHVRDALRRAGGSTESSVVADVCAEIEWARARGVGFLAYHKESVTCNRVCPVREEVFNETWRIFEETKREENCLDFADILERAAELLQQEDVVVRVRAKWRAVVVDEFQDTDPLQYRFISSVRGNSRLFSVVGDPRQNIYSFKGADPRILDSVTAEDGCTVVELDTSYRCGSGILEAANKLVGETYGKALQWVRESDKPVLLVCTDEDDEARTVARRIQDANKHGVPYEEMAVLYRFNSSSATFEAALNEAGIPYEVSGGVKFFDRPEVKAVLQPFGQSARTSTDADGLSVLEQCAVRTGWRRDEPPSGIGAVRNRWESVSALMDLAGRYEGSTAGELLSHLLQMARTGVGVGVTLATVHAAKGLEWDEVFVTGCVEGQIPSAYAKSGVEIEEERRLLYVATTRARKKVYFSLPMRRFKRPSEASRFLGAMRLKGATMLPGSRGGSKDSRTRNGQQVTSKVSPAVEALLHCRTCGRKLAGIAARTSKVCSSGCLDGVEKDRYSKLVAWRADQAAELLEEPEDLISDRALFQFCVTGRTGAGWRPSIKPPSI